MAIATMRAIGGPNGHLAHMWAFAGNSMTGDIVPDGRYYGTHGRLPGNYSHLLTDATIRAELAYVVFSYATPIAWVDIHGIVTIPDVSYSPTTSRHQGACRAWLASARVTAVV